MTSLTPSPIPLVDCDRHHLRLTESACQTFGHSREDCIGCAKSDHIADVGKMVKGNSWKSWSAKYAAFIQTRAKHKQKKVEAKVEVQQVQPITPPTPPIVIPRRFGPRPKNLTCKCGLPANGGKGKCKKCYNRWDRLKHAKRCNATIRAYRNRLGHCSEFDEDIKKGACMQRVRNRVKSDRWVPCAECRGKSWKAVGE